MTNTIDSQNDTFWKVAYGKELYFPAENGKTSTRVVHNKAADEIIRNDEMGVLLGKIFVACGTILFTIGAILAFYLSNCNGAQVDLLSIASCVTAVAVTATGGFIWYKVGTRLTENKSKPLIAIKDRLLDDIEAVKRRNSKSPELGELKRDAELIKTALQHHAKKV